MQARAEAETYNHKMVWSCIFSNSSTVVIFPRLTQYFQIMPNFEDFQQLKSWKRQGAGAPTKFYKSNKENISCPIAVYSCKLWKSKTNFEHWKFMKSHQIAQYQKKLSPNLPLDYKNCLSILNYILPAIIGNVGSDWVSMRRPFSSIEIKAWLSH